LKLEFSIITVCKGRLEHLKKSLPNMVGQEGAEVIVVDYSCPDRAGDYVARHWPGVRVVTVEGEEGFSNWKGRNRGAAAATGNMLVFCDADTILTQDAVARVARAVPKNAFAHFPAGSTAHLNTAGIRLSNNQLRGFQIVPTGAFRQLGGYDEVLSGYAAGGDTDLQDRLLLIGLKSHSLGGDIVEAVVPHDNAARFAFHREPIQISYAAGLLYRRAKMVLLKARKRGLPLTDRQRLYQTARRAAELLGKGSDVASLKISLSDRPVGMPRQLGFERGRCTVTITVELSLHDKIEAPPE
jgi:glycosyltransferase involved in cell wall biosynthesis